MSAYKNTTADNRYSELLELLIERSDEEGRALLRDLDLAVGDRLVEASAYVLDHVVVGFRVPGCSVADTEWRATSRTDFDPIGERPLP